MAGDFIATRTYIYTSGAVIFAARHNTNEVAIYAGHNNAMNSSTGHQHTGITGDAPKLTSAGLDLTANYAWTGNHTFAGTFGVTSSDSTTTISASDFTLQANDSRYVSVKSFGTSKFSSAKLSAARGTLTVPTLLVNGDKVGDIQFLGYDGAAYQTAGRISMTTADAVSAGKVPADMIVTLSDPASGAETECFRVTADGHAGVQSAKHLTMTTDQNSHIAESSAGNGRWTIGGVTAFNVTTTLFAPVADISVPSGNKYIMDGATGHAYWQSSSTNSKLYTNNANVLDITSTSIALPSIPLVMSSGYKVCFDGTASSANHIQYGSPSAYIYYTAATRHIFNIASANAFSILGDFTKVQVESGYNFQVASGTSTLGGAVTVAGNITPTSTNSYTLGDATHTMSNVHAQNLTTYAAGSVFSGATISSASDVNVMSLSGTNTGAGKMHGIYFNTTDGTFDGGLFRFAASYVTTPAVGAYYGTFPVEVDGVGTKYIHLFNA